MTENPASQWRKESKIRYNRLMRTLKLTIALLSVVAVLSSASAFAQSMVPLNKEQQAEFDKQKRMNMEPAIEYRPLGEPSFDKVTFLKLDPPKSMSERIERLIHGIYIDIPPEYDHYGYEVRRYMAAVAGPEILGSKANLQGQIKNIKTAEIILKYWRESSQKEIAAIEAEIEENGASSSTRSSFKYHRGVAQAFFVEANSWLRNNRALLEYLDEINPEGYKFDSHIFEFKNQKYLRRFASFFKAQQNALKEIQGYTPFRMMVY